MAEAPARRRSRRLGPDDLRLWHHVTRDVTPLRAPPPHGDDAPPAEPKATPPTSDIAAPATPRATAAPGRRGAALPELAPGTIADIDRATADRLRRGRLAIDGRLDLHGLTQDEAHAALDRFLAGSAARGRRCVLVITGKGLGDAVGRGVLRQAVPRWLNHAPNRPRILAVMPAQPKHGGAGALYVLLKRQR